MANLLRLIRLLTAVVVFWCLCVTFMVAQPPVVRVGMAFDGPSERNQILRETFQQEITVLLEDEFDVQFPTDKQLEADWTLAGVRTIVDRLLSDREVDHVLTLGILSSSQAAALAANLQAAITAHLADNRRGQHLRDGFANFRIVDIAVVRTMNRQAKPVAPARIL